MNRVYVRSGIEFAFEFVRLWRTDMVAGRLREDIEENCGISITTVQALLVGGVDRRFRKYGTRIRLTGKRDGGSNETRTSRIWNPVELSLRIFTVP